jgi:hypothetical protein
MDTSCTDSFKLNKTVTGIVEEPSHDTPDPCQLYAETKLSEPIQSAESAFAVKAAGAGLFRTCISGLMTLSNPGMRLKTLALLFLWAHGGWVCFIVYISVARLPMFAGFSCWQRGAKQQFPAGNFHVKNL